MSHSLGHCWFLWWLTTIFMHIFQGVRVRGKSLSIYNTLSIHPSVYPSIYLSMCVYLSIYLSIHLSIYPSIHPSIYLCIWTQREGWREGRGEESASECARAIETRFDRAIADQCKTMTGDLHGRHATIELYWKSFHCNIITSPWRAENTQATQSTQHTTENVHTCISGYT